MKMKQCAVAVLAAMVLLGGSLELANAAGTGSVAGKCYMPNTARGMHANENGVVWDMSAPKGVAPRGLDVWLISESLDASTISDAELSAWYREKIVPQGQPIYYASTDTKGNYSFADIPAGTYYLVLMDCYDLSEEASMTKDVLEKELAQRMRNWDEFQLYLVGVNQMVIRKITVEPEQEVYVHMGKVTEKKQ